MSTILQAIVYLYLWYKAPAFMFWIHAVAGLAIIALVLAA